jgi:hypothetical protein
MNERLKEIAVKAQVEHCVSHVRLEEFAKLIVQECLAQVARVDDMLEDEPAQHAAVAWVALSISKHFDVAESSAQAEQEAAAFIAAEDKKVASRYGYVPKLHPSEWKD